LLIISAQPGEEILASISRQLAEHGVDNGAVVSLIGAVDRYCISNMPKGNAKDDILTEYDEPGELSGTGEIIDGALHVHAVLGTEGDNSRAGHLHWAHADTWFVRAYVMPAD
jgi:predicted DNA-binding protein with PD1-like motif